MDPPGVQNKNSFSRALQAPYQQSGAFFAGGAEAWGAVLSAVTEKLDRIEDKLDTLREEHLASAKRFLQHAQYVPMTVGLFPELLR